MSRDGTYKRATDAIVTVPMSREFHRKLRVHCAEEGRTMKWVMTKAAESYLAWHEQLKELGAVEDGAEQQEQGL